MKALSSLLLTALCAKALASAIPPEAIKRNPKAFAYTAAVMATAVQIRADLAEAEAGTEAEVAVEVDPASDGADVATPDPATALEKRKGGGGRDGRGGGGGKSGSSGGSGGKSGSSGSSGAKPGKGTPTLGFFKSGAGGGRYYGGGAASPYPAGSSRSGLATPLLLTALVWNSMYPHGHYFYRYPVAWTYTDPNTGRTETDPAYCYCQAFDPCTCEFVDDAGYRDEVVKQLKVKGGIAAREQVNGSVALVINGTVANGTEPGTAGAAAGLHVPAATLALAMLMAALMSAAL